MKINKVFYLVMGIIAIVAACFPHYVLAHVGIEHASMAVAIVAAVNEQDASLQKYRALFSQIPNFQPKNLQWTYLRYEFLLLNGVTQYEVIIQDNNKEFATERKLSNTDCFVAEQHGMFIGIADTTHEGAEVLYTYPNGVALFTVAGAGTSAALATLHFNAIYNGTFEIRTNNDITQPFTTLEFLVVPQTPQTTTANRDQYGPPEKVPYGFFSSTGKNVYSGAADSKVIFTFPTTGLTDLQATTGTYQTRIVYITRGLRAVGGADYSNDYSSLLTTGQLTPDTQAKVNGRR